MATDENPLNRWIDVKLGVLDAEAWAHVHSTAPEHLTRLRSKLADWRRRRGRRAVLGTALALVALSVLSTGTARVFATRCVEACVSAATRLTGALTQPAQGIATGSVAPDFTALDQAGRVLQLGSLRGQVVLLNFWATWCVPCRQEIPWFAEFQQRYSARGFTVVGLSLDEDGWAAVRPFAETHRIDYRLGVADQSTVSSYGVQVLPTTVLIGRDGRIAMYGVGVPERSLYERAIVGLLD
ncbi:MAG: TlpA family protein disulfide reductase [Acidobacteria bacterium]|nr:TlpA family protein disulfide reductase [Acidobacteriota bacterium]